MGLEHELIEGWNRTPGSRFAQSHEHYWRRSGLLWNSLCGWSFVYGRFEQGFSVEPHEGVKTCPRCLLVLKGGDHA